MPTYQSKCPICNTKHEYIRTVANRNDVPNCCGKPTIRTLDTPMVSAMSFTGHKGMHMPDAKNTWIEDGAAYKKYIKENNLIVGNEGKQEAAMNKARLEKQADIDRRKTVEEVVNKSM